MAHTEEATIDLARIRWIGLKTIVIREYGRIIRIWGQTLVPSAVTAILYFVIFGSLIGGRVGQMAVSATGSTSRPASS
jgi:ABC-2 type transport system permease protein